MADRSQNELYDLGAVAEPLCHWYEEHGRTLPWREEPSPYHVWLSEIMLQQTRIEAVLGYYARFTDRFPGIRELAEADEEELLKLWEGLGYYNRARNLQKTAKIVVERYNGQLPADYDLLLTLPGIGSYTAGAVASIAYGLLAPAVDGNVLRVAMRYLNCEDDISKMAVRKKLERSVMAVIPLEKPGIFNQALMELGEVICIPNGRPLCDRCPLSNQCAGRKHGRQMELPNKPKKKKRVVEKRTILIPMWEGKAGIRKRQTQGLLAGMWEFPSREGHLTPEQLEEGFVGSVGVTRHVEIRRLEPGTHIFTHKEWHMEGYCLIFSEQEAVDRWNQYMPEMIWATTKELAERYSIPAAFHSFMRQIPFV